MGLEQTVNAEFFINTSSNDHFKLNLFLAPLSIYLTKPLLFYPVVEVP